MKSTFQKLLGGVLTAAVLAAGLYASLAGKEPSGAPATQAPAQPVKPTGAAPATPQAGTIKVGAWNIEWLGKPEDRSGAAKNIAQAPADLADCIAASGVAILAVEEIVARDPGRPTRSREIEATIEALKGRTGAQWDYVLFPGRAVGDQLTGILWNTAVVTALTRKGESWRQTADSPWEVPIPRGRSAQGSSLWNRPPHAMKFSAGRGKTDIVVIVVHMKADYNGDFAAHRGEEARALAAALPAVRTAFSDSDLVIIGDTNCTQDREPAVAALEGAGLVDLNKGRTQTHWRGGAMDRAFVPADQPEFAGRAFGAVSGPYLDARRLTPAEFKKWYSDHYLITTEVKVMQDDD
jgi:hypothetical protein